MKLGFYYSQAQDWHDPNGAGNTWDFGPDENKDFDKYLREKAEPQVRNCSPATARCVWSGSIRRA